MAIALLLALVLPLAQEDPHVTYREGLFEEVDQGNLEKAAELYGKILKSGAPDALKAKALLRTGFCHEKKGKRKEAEQAWRDVIERFPSAAETVKVARERLSRPEFETSGRTEDEQVQAEMLNLGSLDYEVPKGARRKLLLLGERAVPHLRQALRHRDRTLSNNAAWVLVDMGLHEGVYESIRRFWLPEGEPSHQDANILERLLKDEATRRAFLKDVDALKKSSGMAMIAGTLTNQREPEFSKVVEDWIVDRDEVPTGVIDTWLRNRPPPDVLRLMKRLTAESPPSIGRALYAFREHANAVQEPDRELRKEALRVLSLQGGEGYFSELAHLARYVEPSEIVRGPVTSWLSRGSIEDRKRILERINQLRNDEHQKALYAEISKFLYEQLAAPGVPLETKELIVASGYGPGNAEELKKYLAFGLEFWKEHRGQRAADLGVVSKGDARALAMRQVLSNLSYYLPPDSKDLPAVLDDSLNRGLIPAWGEQSKERRPVIMAAVLRSLSRNKTHRQRTLNWLDQVGTPLEKLEVGGLLSTWDKDDTLWLATSVYVNGFRSLDKSDQDAHWKVLHERFTESDPSVQNRIAHALIGMESDRVEEIMKEAGQSKDPGVRFPAIQHWSRPNTHNPQGLMAALRDPEVGNQIQAVTGLRTKPSLEVVPSLIDLLNSPSTEVRENAAAALAAIKQHFEAQAEWKRWYDETKKALGK